MKQDNYGQFILTEQDLCDYYLSNPTLEFKYAIVETPINFHEDLNLEQLPNLLTYVSSKLSIEDFDIGKQNGYKIPIEYEKFDVVEFILNQCSSDAELQRAGEELLLFQDRNLIGILKYLKYLVDTMRHNNVVWGVGRGSSVASFVLFLLGVHKINSLYYDIPISEFIK